MIQELLRPFTDLLTPPPPQQFRRALAPRYFERRASGSLDADHIHSVVTRAKEGNMTDLLALYRDIETADDVINGALATRKLAVLSDPPSVVPCRADVPEDQEAAERFQAVLDNSPTWLDGANHLLNATVWPVAVAEITWRAGVLEYDAFELRSIPLEQLSYQDNGSLRIALVDASGQVSQETEYPDPARYLVHRGHLGTHPDTWGGPFRALLFWHLFTACDRDWWARFLERFGAPFLVGKYDPDDDESRQVLETAFSEAARTFGIVTTQGTDVELNQATSSVGADSFERFLDIGTAAKTRLILGQTLSSKTDASGMGSGTAALQGSVRSEYKAWDRLRLAATVRRGIIEPWMRANGLRGEAPKIQWPGDPAELAQFGHYLQAAATAGLEIDDDGLAAINSATGIPLRRVGPMLAPGAADQAAQLGQLKQLPHPNSTPMPPQVLATLLASLPPSVLSTGSVARGGAADYLRALGVDHAALATILANASSRSGLIDAFETHLLTLARPETAQALLDVSAASAANAAA